MVDAKARQTLAEKLEEVALKDDYLVERNLYPNVDFYSGVILRAIGIPKSMFTVIFSIGRVLEHVTRFMTLEPGDLIMTGTPAGVGAVVPGDVLRGTIGDLDPVETRIV